VVEPHRELKLVEAQVWISTAMTLDLITFK